MSSIKGPLLSKVTFCQWLPSIIGHLSLQVISHQWLCFIKGQSSKVISIQGCFPSKVVFQQRLFSITGCQSSMVLFHQKISSTKSPPTSKFIFHQLSSSINGCLETMVSKDIKGCLPQKYPPGKGLRLIPYFVYTPQPKLNCHITFSRLIFSTQKFYLEKIQNPGWSLSTLVLLFIKNKNSSPNKFVIVARSWSNLILNKIWNINQQAIAYHDLTPDQSWLAH